MNCSQNHIKRSPCSPKMKALNAKTLKDLADEYQKERHLREEWSVDRFFHDVVFGDLRQDAPKLPQKPSETEWSVYIGKVKTHSHQTRIPKGRLRKIAERLAANWNRNSFKDFEDLYDYVSSILVKSTTNPNGLVKNPYALIIYDIALRLAFRYGVWPQKYVYLNGSGPYEAAKTLKLRKYIKKRKILYSDVIKQYPELGNLDAAEIEDFFCIYRKQIESIIAKRL